MEQSASWRKFSSIIITQNVSTLHIPPLPLRGAFVANWHKACGTKLSSQRSELTICFLFFSGSISISNRRFGLALTAAWLGHVGASSCKVGSRAICGPSSLFPSPTNMLPDVQPRLRDLNYFPHQTHTYNRSCNNVKKASVPVGNFPQPCGFRYYALMTTQFSH